VSCSFLLARRLIGRGICLFLKGVFYEKDFIGLGFGVGIWFGGVGRRSSGSSSDTGSGSTVG
jgi:hypothetical protein